MLPGLVGINSFVTLLSDTKLFNFIAKISFCTYLIHLIVINWFVGTRTYDRLFQQIDVLCLTFGILVISLFFGFVLTVTIEIPFSKMQKKLFENLIKEQLRKSN